MAETYYATTTIRHGKTENGGKTTTLSGAGGTTVTLLTSSPEFETINDGEEVKKSDFSDEDFQALVDAGAVTTNKAEVFGATSTKTADVQAQAQGRHRGNDEFPEQEDDPDELDKAANEQAAKESSLVEQFGGDLTDEEREALAGVPIHNQRHALSRMRASKVEEGLASSDSDSKKAKSPSPTAQKSTT